MIIHILALEGSPLGVSIRTLEGNDPAQIGCGGSEAAILTLCEAWHNRGEKVVFYNNPREGWWSPFEQKPISSFNPSEDRDVLIIFRSPHPAIDQVDNCLKVFLSCDQQTTGDYVALNKKVHKTVCISPHHIQYFRDAYNIQDAIYIDLPIRTKDFKEKLPKVKNRFIFSTVPARGIDNLFAMWNKIKANIPDATLVVTSDYRLWGSWLERSDGEFVARALSLPDITYRGALPRPEYINELMQAEIAINPNHYQELFCITIAEAQVAGAYAISSGTGALKTTNMCTVIDGDPRQNAVRDMFVDESVKFCNLTDKEKHGVFKAEIKRAKERFRPNIILEQWDRLVFCDPKNEESETQTYLCATNKT